MANIHIETIAEHLLAAENFSTHRNWQFRRISVKQGWKDARIRTIETFCFITD